MIYVLNLLWLGCLLSLFYDSCFGWTGWFADWFSCLVWCFDDLSDYNLFNAVRVVFSFVVLLISLGFLILGFLGCCELGNLGFVCNFRVVIVRFVRLFVCCCLFRCAWTVVWLFSFYFLLGLCCWWILFAVGVILCG